MFPNKLANILSLTASLPSPPLSPPVLSYQSFKVRQSAWCCNNLLAKPTRPLLRIKH